MARQNAQTDSPIFLVGRHRSGTSMFWNIFRQSDRYFCLYEPLNEYLLDGVLGSETFPLDPTHTGIADYWTEYRTLDKDRLISCWHINNATKNIRLGRYSFAPGLKRYLDFLLNEGAQHGIPLIKFVNADFKTGWLRRQYPDARIIHLLRRPHEVWESMFHRDGTDNFEERPELLDKSFFIHIYRILDTLSNIDIPGHPYRLFYTIWLLSYKEVSGYAQDTWWYNEAVDNFNQWAEVHLIRPGLLDESTVSRVDISPRRTFNSLHPAEWYQEHEKWVEEQLRIPGNHPKFRSRLSTSLVQFNRAIGDEFPFGKIRRYSKALYERIAGRHKT